MGKELKNLTVAVLAPNRHEVQPLDLYLNISQNITLSVVGKNEVHLSGYFEPNNSVEDQLYGAGMEDELDDDDEEEEEDVEDKLFGSPGGASKPAEAAKNPLDKSLKAARKNALKNTMNDEDDGSSDDESSGDDDVAANKSEEDSSSGDLDGIDLEAEEGEDEEIDSEELGDSDSEDNALMAKLAEIKKKQNKVGKQAPASESDEDDVSDLQDDSEDSEEADLKYLLSKKK